MKRITVQIPIAGSVTVTIETDTPVEDTGALMNEAIDAYNEMSEREQRDCVEWEWFDKIADGNVLHAPCNEVEVWEED